MTLGTFVLLPEASFAFWGGALQDPNRLGPNARHVEPVAARVPAAGGPGRRRGTALWLACVVVVGVVGLRASPGAPTSQGDSVSEVAAVGLMAVLLSPVAWIHHLHWMVVVVLAMLGADPLRDRRRLWAGPG